MIDVLSEMYIFPSQIRRYDIERTTLTLNLILLEIVLSIIKYLLNQPSLAGLYELI